MKVYLLLISIAGGVFFEGCASPHHEIVLEPVGPASNQLSKSSQGTLAVFSAWDSAPRFNDALQRNHHTDYQLFAANGALLRKVHNDDDVALGPKYIALEPGNYRVVARANGYGWVTVPVIIEARKTTLVHLEGADLKADGVALENSNPVRLPGGEIVGWRAGTRAMTKRAEVTNR